MSNVVQAVNSNKVGDDVLSSLAGELNRLPNGSQVFQKLIKDPDACKRLAAMPPAGQLLELGRISERLEGRHGGFVSKSAPPIRPVNSGNTKSTVPLDKVSSMAEYNRLRDAGRVR